MNESITSGRPPQAGLAPKDVDEVMHSNASSTAGEKVAALDSAPTRLRFGAPRGVRDSASVGSAGAI